MCLHQGPQLRLCQRLWLPKPLPMTLPTSHGPQVVALVTTCKPRARSSWSCRPPGGAGLAPLPRPYNPTTKPAPELWPAQVLVLVPVLEPVLVLVPSLWLVLVGVTPVMALALTLHLAEAVLGLGLGLGLALGLHLVGPVMVMVPLVRPRMLCP